MSSPSFSEKVKSAVFLTERDEWLGLGGGNQREDRLNEERLIARVHRLEADDTSRMADECVWTKHFPSSVLVR
jgi:hypothetical protein